METKVHHVGNCAAKIETQINGHFLPVFLGDNLSVVHDGNICHVPHFVAEPVVAMFVAELQHCILNALSHQKSIFGHRLEWLNVIRVHARTWQCHLWLGQTVWCLLDETVVVVSVEATVNWAVSPAVTPVPVPHGVVHVSRMLDLFVLLGCLQERQRSCINDMNRCGKKKRRSCELHHLLACRAKLMFL